MVAKKSIGSWVVFFTVNPTFTEAVKLSTCEMDPGRGDRLAYMIFQKKFVAAIILENIK